MATHSSVLAWRIPGMGEPGGLPSLGSHRVGHDWSDLAAAAADSSPEFQDLGNFLLPPSNIHHNWSHIKHIQPWEACQLLCPGTRWLNQRCQLLLYLFLLPHCSLWTESLCSSDPLFSRHPPYTKLSGTSVSHCLAQSRYSITVWWMNIWQSKEIYNHVQNLPRSLTA